MTTIDMPAGGPAPVETGPQVEIVVPVFDEERTLAASVARLRRYLDAHFPFSTLVTIADNASTDGTWAIARRLSEGTPGLRAVHLAEKGRGRALRSTWLRSRAPVVAYMDVDLSTDLDALLPLVAPLLSGHSDLSIGTRLAPGSRVVRGSRRECISRIYNALVHAALGGRFSDAQCGFKAMRADAARALLPLVEDDGWFFDTELLVLAQRNGLRIHEVPVDWVDDPDSRVDVAATARADLRGIWRLMRTLSAGRGRVGAPASARGGADAPAIARIAGVGLFTSVAYLVLFLALRPALGAYLANASAIIFTALGNAGIHARMAPPPGSHRARRRLRAGVALASLASLVMTTAALALAGAAGGTSAAAQTAAVIVGTALAAPVRFVAIHAASGRPPRPVALSASGKEER